MNTEFIKFIGFSVFGLAGLNKEFKVFIELATQGSIEALTFENIKFGSGFITYGYHALSIHFILLIASCLFCYIAWQSLKKILKI